MIRLALLVAALGAGAAGIGTAGPVTWALVALPWCSGLALLGAMLWHRRAG